ncbi:unnamed protein product [Caenorhabditis nigoni]
MPTFPFTKLPNVALSECLRILNPFELYKFSKCSKRSQKMVYLAGTQNWTMKYEGTEIILKNRNRTFSFEEAKNPEEVFETRLHVLMGDWERRKMKIQFSESIFLELLDIFRCSIISDFDFWRKDFGMLSKMDRELEVQNLTIWDLRSQDDLKTAMEILQKINISLELYFPYEIKVPFEFKLSKYPKSLFIMKSAWFKIHHLLDCSSPLIMLLSSELTNKDLGLYLEKWKNCEFPNLECLHLVSEHIDRNTEIFGMKLPIENKADRFVYGKECNGRYYTISSGVKIARNDGIEAMLRVEFYGLGNIVTLYVLE